MKTMRRIAFGSPQLDRMNRMNGMTRLYFIPFILFILSKEVRGLLF